MNSIFFGFVILDALVLWLLIVRYARRRWLAPVIVLVLAFNFAVWHSLGSYTGWPTRDALPAHAVFISAIVDEPVSQEDPGAIYVWLIPDERQGGLLNYSSSQYEPRAYHEPYTRDLHRAILSAQALQRKGSLTHRHVEFTTRHGRKLGSGTPGHSFGRFHAYILPPAAQTRKGVAP